MIDGARHVRPGERVLWEARPSMVGLVPILLSALGAIAGLAATTYFRVDQPGLLLTGVPALVVAVLGILAESGRRFLRLRFTSYLVTEERLYVVTSFVSTDVRAVPLARASRVSVRQGIFGRALGFWSAEVTTYDAGREREQRAVSIPAIRDGPGLLQHVSAGLRRNANVAWLRRGD